VICSSRNTWTLHRGVFLRKSNTDSEILVNREFARLGDMDAYMRRKELLGEEMITCAIPEEHLWRIMHCLARGFLVLATGTEDPKKPDINWGRP
jgi:hypothetical protein